MEYKNRESHRGRSRLFCIPRDLNDPFEFRWRESWPSKEIDIDVFVRELCAAEYPNDTVLERRIRFPQLLESCKLAAAEAKKSGGSLPTLAKIKQGVFCASVRPDHPVMWSHYGDSHRGVCVGLRVDAFSPSIFRPIIYSNDLPTIDVFDYVRSSNGIFAELALRKAIAWSYEEEWRTIRAPGLYNLPDLVEEVVLGSLCDAKTEAAVRQSVDKAGCGIRISRARLSEVSYEVVID